MASVSAGHSTIFASLAVHRAPNAADPAAVIRSTTCNGGTSGGIGGCGISSGGIGGGTEAVGLMRRLSGIPRLPLGRAGISPTHLYRRSISWQGTWRQEEVR